MIEQLELRLLKGDGGMVGYGDFTEPMAELENFTKSGQVEAAGKMLERVKCQAEGIIPPVMEDVREEE